MNFCTSCGQKLSDQQAFCTACGAEQQPKEKSVPKQTAVSNNQTPKKPMSQKARLTWVISASVVGVLVVAHFIVSSMIDPMKQVQAMDRAMVEGNEESFFEHVQLDESALIHKDEFMSYIDYVGWDSARDQMTDVINGDVDSEFDSIIYGGSGSELFVMKKESIVPLLYHTYEIEAMPKEIQVSTNYGPSTLAIDGETFEFEGIEEDKSLVYSYPGIYELTGEASSEFGSLAALETIEVDSLGKEPHSVSLDFPGETADFSTNQPEAELFVNGESTGKSLSEFDTLGPFSDEEEVVMHAEWTSESGETLQTEPFTQFDWSYGGFAFDFPESTKSAPATPVDTSSTDGQDVQQHVLDFRTAYEAALNAIDYGKIAPYLLNGSQAEEDLSEYIGDLKNEGFYYDFTNNQILSAESTGDSTYRIRTREQFIFTNHQGDETFYDREKTYLVRESEGALKIYQIEISDTDRSDL